MSRFTSRFADRVVGVLSGFDRLALRGTLRAYAYEDGLGKYLSYCGVLLKDFGRFVEGITKRVREASLAASLEAGREVRYLPSSRDSKEEIARAIAERDHITEGPICVLKCVEPCSSFDVHRNPETRELELVLEERKCLHLYHYQFHPVFGFMGARLQTWFPFGIQICINGREWLARQMDAQGMSYERRDNCFISVADFERAQQLLDAQLTANWPVLLQGIAADLNPIHKELFGEKLSYYWSVRQSEWATDIVFSDPKFLERLYPELVLYAMTALGSGDILRYLGRRVQANGKPYLRFNGEVTSDLKERHEGVRIKHTVNGNSLKAYDKAYELGLQLALLRIEMTMSNPEDFRVWRPKEGGPEDDLAWRELRRGIADMHRRAQVSQRANERYLDALAGVREDARLGQLAAKVARPVTWKGKRVRALNLLGSEDCALLDAIARGEFVVNGLRNRDLQRILFKGDPSSPQEARRRSAAVTRKLRLLRAHGIITKVQHTHRYQVTREGRTLLTAMASARRTPVDELLRMAA